MILIIITLKKKTLTCIISKLSLHVGRRWNVETNKVDIVPFKADRLFVGTLGFTVLLFLLPTTAMYYAVFTVLRLMVLFVKGIIARAIDKMNNLPVFPLIIACVRPDLLPGMYVCVVLLFSVLKSQRNPKWHTSLSLKSLPLQLFQTPCTCMFPIFSFY